MARPMKIATFALPSQIWTPSRAATSASRARRRCAYSSSGRVTGSFSHDSTGVRSLCCFHRLVIAEIESKSHVKVPGPFTIVQACLERTIRAAEADRESKGEGRDPERIPPRLVGYFV